MTEDGIQPKTADAMRAWVKDVEKVDAGGCVLIGLVRRETLVSKIPDVDMLFNNMLDQLTLLSKTDLPKTFSLARVHVALEYQACPLGRSLKCSRIHML